MIYTLNLVVYLIPFRFVSVSEFAKKTGDYHNLSAVDLHLIALTYQMCKENLSSEEFARLKSEPPKENVTI